MEVSFYEAQLRGRYFFPGRNAWGTVRRLEGVRRRTGVVIQFDGATQVLITRKNWYAFKTDKGIPSAAVPSKVVAATPQKQVAAMPKAKILTATKKAKPRSKRRIRSHAKNIPVEEPIQDNRPVPDIPGPPVPKPRKGVWEELGIACLRKV